MWLIGIKSEETRNRIRSRLTRVELGNFGDYKALGGGLFELRLQFGPGYRIYFGTVNNSVILLLGGGDKSSQGSDIQKARKYWEDFRRQA
jgi:putative addiction module killer protein